MIALKLRNIGKCFDVSDKREGLAQNVLSKIRLSNNKFWALKNISFDVKKGECIGIIGDNGSGKSTLLKILAGITTPSEGEVEINGKVGSFLELGVGFQGELSGRENVFFYGSLLGLKKEDIEKVYGNIAEFSGLKGVMEQPIRTYSSGMLARLAFSVLSFTNPDILLLDEVISVGDHSFKQKSLNKLLEFRRKNKTILIVSHGINELPKICDKCILLEKGKMVSFGNTQNTTEDYIIKTNNKNKLNLLNQIKEENSGNYDNGKLLYLYNELSMILDNMTSIKKGKLIKGIYEHSIKEDYQDLIKLYEEKVRIMKKVLFCYKKKNPEINYLLILYENLIDAVNQLRELYENHLQSNSNEEHAKKLGTYKEEIKLIKEVIPIISQLGRSPIKFYNNLTYKMIEYSEIDESEKKYVLLDVKRVLKEGLKKEKDSKEILTLLIRVTEELVKVLEEKEMQPIFTELREYTQKYTELSNNNKEKNIMKYMVEEQINLTKDIRKRITIALNELKSPIKEQIKKEQMLFFDIRGINKYKNKNFSKKSFNFMLYEKLINDISYIQSFKVALMMDNSHTNDKQKLNDTLKEIIKNNLKILKNLKIIIKNEGNIKKLENLETEYNKLIKSVK